MLPFWMTPWVDFAASVTIFANFLIPLTIWIIYNIYRVRVICNLAHETQEEALDLLTDHYKSMAFKEMKRYDNLTLYLFDCGDFISPLPDGCEIGQEEMSDITVYKGTKCKDMFGKRSK